MKRVVGGECTAMVRVSDSTPGSSFRELDDVFLQTQARIWLGEVLHLRFDEETSMADLIADGELLFQVSKVIWKNLAKKNSDLKHSKLHIYERTSSSKNDGRYLRYTKVDSFLKICQILGLAGIDLFTPSDVVEKRDTRKVCMCIRSLSIKSRSKYLKVPDFDVVTYTIAMPNYVVGGICRNLLERSKSSDSNSGSYQKRSYSGNFESQEDLNYDSDEAESCLTNIEFENPNSNLNSNFDAIPSDLNEEIRENCPEISEKQRNLVSNANFDIIQSALIGEIGKNCSDSSEKQKDLVSNDNFDIIHSDLNEEIGENCPENSELKQRDLVSNVNFDIIQSDLNEEIGDNCPKISEKQSDLVSNSNFDITQPDLIEETGENCPEISELKQRDLISNATFDIIQSDLIEEIGENCPEISDNQSEIKTSHIKELARTSSLFSCESSNGDNWQGQNNNFTPESKLVKKNEVETEMEGSSNNNRISDGENSILSAMSNVREIYDSKFELDNLVIQHDVSNLDSNYESEDLDLNSGDLTCQNEEKISYSEFSLIENLISDAKFGQGENIEEELDEEIILEEFCLKFENKLSDLNSEDLTNQNEEKIGYYEEKDKVITSIEEFNTSTEIKADDEFETEKVIEECKNKENISEKELRNKSQLGQKVLTSVAVGVALAGSLLISHHFRMRGRERKGVIGLPVVQKTKEESSERNIQKPKTVYPGQWIKI